MLQLHWITLITIAALVTPSISQSSETESELSIDELTNMNLEQIMNVEVTGVSKSSENISETPMSVYVVSYEDMLKWGITQQFELASHVPGYSFYNVDYYGQYGVQSRGLNTIWRYGTSIELMPWVDPGHWTFTPHFFKSVEVARGPGGGLTWGSAAEAGLSNYNIRDDLEGTQFILQTGNRNQQALDALFGRRFEGGKKGDGLFIGYHQEQQDALVYHDVMASPPANNTQLDTFRMNGIHPSNTVLVKAQLNGLKFIYVRDQAHHVAPNLWFGTDELYNKLVSASGSNWGDHLVSDIYRIEYHVPTQMESFSLQFYHNYYKRNWWPNNIATLGEETKSFGFISQLKLSEEKLVLDFGGDLHGAQTLQYPSVSSAWGSTSGVNWYESTKESSKTEFRNLYLNAKYDFTDDLKATLGARFDSYPGQSSHATLVSAPRFGLIYSLDPSSSVKYLFISTKRRAATNEIISSTPDPESLTAHELIYLKETAKLNLSLTAFYQTLSNGIKRENNGTFNDFTNTGDLYSAGLEFGVRYKYRPSLELIWNGYYTTAKATDAKITSNGTTFNSSVPRDDQGNVLFWPISSSFLGADYSLNRESSVGIYLRSVFDIPYQKENSDYAKISAHFLDVTYMLKNVWTKNLNFNFAVINATDNRQAMPAFGEHVNNRAGTVPADGLLASVQTSYTF